MYFKVNEQLNISADYDIIINQIIVNCRYLLENGADVGAVNYDGELPVDIAESDTMEEILQKAIDEKG